MSLSKQGLSLVIRLSNCKQVSLTESNGLFPGGKRDLRWVSFDSLHLFINYIWWKLGLMWARRAKLKFVNHWKGWRRKLKVLLISLFGLPGLCSITFFNLKWFFISLGEILWRFFMLYLLTVAYRSINLLVNIGRTLKRLSFRKRRVIMLLIMAPLSVWR